jgi:hypothetical protein
MDAAFVLQLVNGLLLCWLGTEVVVSGKPPSLSQGSWGAVGGWAALNAVVAISQLPLMRSLLVEGRTLGAGASLAQRIASLLALPITWPLSTLHYLLHNSLGPHGVLSFIATSAIAAVIASRKLKQGDSLSALMRQPSTWAGFLGTWATLWMLLHSMELFQGLQVDLPLRIVVIASAYYALSLWDVRRRKPDMTHAEFAGHFITATAKSLLLLPLATVVVAATFLALVTVVEGAGLSSAWLNWPIYYGALYGPFCTIYYFARQQALSARLLPM